ncbi:hypothetical protein [Methylogaea oryzae]|uniref:Uncharacterized protein n=1 Tax=Methylogaea oryzae TaxID=1295382 RepID=A0A8D5AKF0_9GAMM|nr:hypothetical protein [Methylogaea oryzae]BBL71056.1 hypothetical protein MoryE10_16620 [Methylogaea oryzae]
MRHSISLLALASTALSGCGLPNWTAPPDPAPPTAIQALELPFPPALPYVSAKELECLSPDTFRRLLEREAIYNRYVETLQATIQSSQVKSPASPNPAQ